MGQVRKQSFHCLLWIVFYLVVIDLALNIIFPFPKEPDKTLLHTSKDTSNTDAPEGKLKDGVRRSRARSAPIMGYGWLQSAV
jgi:hypothetical protein